MKAAALILGLGKALDMRHKPLYQGVHHLWGLVLGAVTDTGEADKLVHTRVA